MKVFNRFLAFIVVLVFALQITGCGGTGEMTGKPKRVPVKVAFWGSPEEIGIITETVNNWQKTHRISR